MLIEYREGRRHRQVNAGKCLGSTKHRGSKFSVFEKIKIIRGREKPVSGWFVCYHIRRIGPLRVRQVKGRSEAEQFFGTHTRAARSILRQVFGKGI